MNADLAALLVEVEPLVEHFTAAGHRLYLVGGIVRDLKAGRDVTTRTDLDLTTDARPEQTKELLGGWVDALWTQGERFGTIGALRGGRAYEITTHRAEVYDPDSRKPAVVYSDVIETDLSRRDFTVNAMALELPGGGLVDPFGGADDLQAGVLRTPLTATTSFSDDPLRMLRAARFVAGHGLEPSEQVVAAMTSMAARLDIVSAERIRDEIGKLLEVDAPDVGLILLEETGLFGIVFPGVERISLNGTLASRVLRLAVLLAEINPLEGGPPTRRQLLRAWRYSNQDCDQIDRLCRGAELVSSSQAEHKDPPGHEFSAEQIRRFAELTGSDRSLAIAVARAKAASARSQSAETVVEAFASALRDLEHFEDLDQLQPVLDGGAIMRLLDLAPGPIVGEAVAYLRERRLRDGPASVSVEEAELRAWWGQRA